MLFLLFRPENVCYCMKTTLVKGGHFYVFPASGNITSIDVLCTIDTLNSPLEVIHIQCDKALSQFTLMTNTHIVASIFHVPSFVKRDLPRIVNFAKKFLETENS